MAQKRNILQFAAKKTYLRRSVQESMKQIPHFWNLLQRKSFSSLGFQRDQSSKVLGFCSDFSGMINTLIGTQKLDFHMIGKMRSDIRVITENHCSKAKERQPDSYLHILIHISIYSSSSQVGNWKSWWQKRLWTRRRTTSEFEKYLEIKARTFESPPRMRDNTDLLKPIQSCCSLKRLLHYLCLNPSWQSCHLWGKGKIQETQ